MTELIFTSNGDGNSLSEQYKLLNPIAFDPYYKPGLPHSGLYSFSAQAIVQPTTPTAVIVDLGDTDILEQVDPQIFADQLYEFLLFARSRAHLDAKIIVAVRKDRFTEEVKAVVDHLRLSGDLLTSYVPYPEPGDKEAWTNFLRIHVVESEAATYKQYSPFINSGSYSSFNGMGRVRFAAESFSGFSSQFSMDGTNEAAHQVLLLIIALCIITALVVLRDTIRTASKVILTRLGVVNASATAGSANGSRYKGVSAKNGVIWD